MKNEASILLRINELKARSDLLKVRLEEEVKKEFSERDLRLIRFLKKEQDVHAFALSQLEWLID